MIHILATNTSTTSKNENPPKIKSCKSYTNIIYKDYKIIKSKP